MLALELTAAPARPAVVAGESLLVVTRVQNSGGAPVEIPAVPGLQFAVVADDGAELVLSAVGFLNGIRRGEPGPNPPPGKRQLAPGKAIEFRDDITQYALERLVPGQYRGLVRLRIGEDVFEALFPFRVDPPHATHVVSAWEPSDRIVSAQDETGGKRPAVLVRSGSSDFPKDGVATRLVEEVKVSSLAVAVNASSPDDRPWAAMIDEAGTVRAMRWGPVVALGAAQSPPLELGKARLISPGFRRASGLFFAVAGEAKGKPSLQIASIGMTGNDDTPGGAKFDKAIKLTASFPFARVLPAEILPIFDDATEALHLVWVENEGKHWRVRHNLIKPSGSAGTDLLVLERQEPLLALAAPCAAKGTPSITALFGPAKKGGPLLHVRAAIDGKGTPALNEVLPPGDKVSAWGISAETGHVLALEGKRLLVIGPGYKEWTRIANVDAKSSHLRVLTAQPGESWAEWFDPQIGLLHERLLPH